MDKAEYLDPVCCFDASQYIGLPDAEPCAAAVDVPDVVKELDRLQNSGQATGEASFRCKVSLWGCTAARATRPLPRVPLRAALSLYAVTVWARPFLAQRSC